MSKYWGNIFWRRSYSILLDLQCDLLHGLKTRVVAPLYAVALAHRPQVRCLTPVFQVEGRAVAMLAPEMAGVPVKRLPPKIASLAGERDAIIAAVDLLFTGA